MKRILKWAGAGLAISILVGGLAWAVRAGKEGSKLDREMATIRAGRYATSRAELEGPAPSDSENAAPHYEAALAKIVEYKGVDVPDALKRGLKALSPEARANVLGWLARNAEAIEGLHRAASFPRCRYSPDRAVKYWRGVELLRMKAQADLDAGRTTAAAETLRDLVALGESFRESPSLLSLMIRCGVLNGILDDIERAPLSERSVLRVVLPDASRLDGEFERALRGELAWACELLSGARSRLRDELHWNPAFGIAMEPFLRSDAARYLAWMRRMIEAGRRSPEEVKAEYEAFRRETEGKSVWTHPFTRMAVPDYPRALEVVLKLRDRLVAK